MRTTGDGRLWSPPGAGAMLRLIRDGDAVTRAELARQTGLARSTVAQRVNALLARGLVYETGASASTGGRPSTVLAFNDDAGLVLAADLGATHTRLAVTDLGGTPLAELSLDMDIAAGPDIVLASVHRSFVDLLDGIGRSPKDVRGIGMGVPGPVSFVGGQPVRPPIMPGWDQFSIPSWFAGLYVAPVLVDNDVNLMAFGEHRTHWRTVEHLLYVKVGTGIGCGIVAGREIHRGPLGAAGDIGHIRLSGHDDVVCECGKVGCLEAVASGRALAAQLSRAGLAASGSRDVVRLIEARDADALSAAHGAGRCIGEVLAGCVNFFSPAIVVLGGDLGSAAGGLLDGVREVVFQRSLPLATRDLRIVRTRLEDHAGVVGAALMVIEHVLAPEAIDLAVMSA